MLNYTTLSIVLKHTYVQFTQQLIAVDAIIKSTKFKAKDFRPDSNTFNERVINKCLRLDIFTDKEYIKKIIELIVKLYVAEETSENLSETVVELLEKFSEDQ